MVESGKLDKLAFSESQQLHVNFRDKVPFSKIFFDLRKLSFVKNELRTQTDPQAVSAYTNIPNFKDHKTLREKLKEYGILGISL